jgi:NAD(P)-dependent dehydrogenase (short-subunit alcohol dehydrogenase family)
MAVEFASKAITVNAIAPGWIRTDMSAPELEHLRDFVLNPSRSVGAPADIARACLWLVDPANRYVTGTVVVVDGGQTAMLPTPWTEGPVTRSGRV